MSISYLNFAPLGSFHCMSLTILNPLIFNTFNNALLFENHRGGGFKPPSL
jgi:hypothetical protein